MANVGNETRNRRPQMSNKDRNETLNMSETTDSLLFFEEMHISATLSVYLNHFLFFFHANRIWPAGKSRNFFFFNV